MLCVALVATSMLLLWPVAETGVMDDWSYVFTAQELARTGHVFYNGWSTALLGWPLYVAAAAIRVCGFSFTDVRITTMAEALFCVGLLHRMMLRAGLSAANAVAGTLVVGFCPLFLYMATTFMSDLPGLLAVVVCLYACLRALEASLERTSRRWIAVAAFSNALLGSARQIAWLGVLVMVPCTLWVLHKRRRVSLDLLLNAAAALAIVATLHWYTTQPYAVPEKLLGERLTLGALGHLVQVAVAFSLDFGLLLAPVALGMWRLPARLKGWRLAVIVGATCGVALFGMRAVRQHHGARYMVPALRYSKVTHPSIESLFAAVTAPPKGPAPRPLVPALQGAATVLAAGALVCVFAAALLPRTCRQRGLPEAKEKPPTFRELVWLTVPFLVAYCALLLPRALSSWLFDRYLLLLLPCAVPLVLRLYQAHGARAPGALAWLLLATLAVFSTASAHDLYAGYRASLAATRALEATGVARTVIDGGWEYNHYSELLVSGHVLQVGMRLPGGSILRSTGPDVPTPPCSLEAGTQTPHVHPRFALAYPGSGCTPVPQIAPMRFRAWLPPTRRTIQVVYADR